jgi:hypothetical protein
VAALVPSTFAHKIELTFTIISADTVSNVVVNVADKFQLAFPPYLLVTDTIFGFAILFFLLLN